MIQIWVLKISSNRPPSVVHHAPLSVFILKQANKSIMWMRIQAEVRWWIELTVKKTDIDQKPEMYLGPWTLEQKRLNIIGTGHRTYTLQCTKKNDGLNRKNNQGAKWKQLKVITIERQSVTSHGWRQDMSQNKMHMVTNTSQHLFMVWWDNLTKYVSVQFLWIKYNGSI